MYITVVLKGESVLNIFLPYLKDDVLNENCESSASNGLPKQLITNKHLFMIKIQTLTKDTFQNLYFLFSKC